jgi:uncharacterized protein YutE (UPF0331/DUF86 family)
MEKDYKKALQTIIESSLQKGDLYLQTYYECIGQWDDLKITQEQYCQSVILLNNSISYCFILKELEDFMNKEQLDEFKDLHHCLNGIVKYWENEKKSGKLDDYIK